MSPEFSHSGTRVAFNDVSEQLWVARADGTHPRRLGPAGLEGRDPRWSPDDTRVAFLDYDGGPALRILDLRTNKVTTVAGGETMVNLAFSWSPDGRWLAVARGEPYACDDLSGSCEDLEL